MARRAFRIGGWAALALGTVTALAAASVVVIGAAAMAGRVTYPVDTGWGPFSIHDGISMPVAYGAEVCQKASTKDTLEEQDLECVNFFVHELNGRESYDGVHVQDAEVRPTVARLTGTVDLATTDGSPLVAVTAARKAIGLMVISGMLLLLWRLLANSAAGEVFSARAVWYVRGIGWLFIVANVVDVILGQLEKGKYSIQMFGAGPLLEPYVAAEIEITQLAVGGLILLLAEVFRHGATVEAEQKLTV